MRKGFILFNILLASLPLVANAMPSTISPPGENMVVVSPRAHQWGAYDSQGRLVKSGVASAGADYCPDMDSQCHTSVGTYRIRSLGGAGCTSPSFPVPRGGSPMPYCMYFTPYQALHGYPHISSSRNASHGCVRMPTSDARWLRYNFVRLGTPVRIESY